ncbi:glycosyltransferase family 8 protein [bacterium]|nr:glycosyltransferase family 8 protein [bacterium]
MHDTQINKIFKNEVSCVFATDNFYAPYLAVAIESIIENSSSKNDYGIYVLEEDLSYENKYKLKLLEKDNIKIEFVNVKDFICQYSSILHLHTYNITIATYFRFFISELFKNFDKLVYLDCDIVVNCDIADLYNINLKGNIVACVRDLQIASWNFQNLIKNKEYYLKVLKLDKIDNYFNAGVMVFNVRKLTEFKCKEKCIKLLQEIKHPKYSDQCILNSVLKDNVLLINIEWNFQNNITKPINIQNNYKNLFNEYLRQEVINAQKNPQIIHYIYEKPWVNLDIINSEKFWEYARKTPFYESIIYSNLIKKIQKTLINNSNKKFYKNFFERIFSVKNLTQKNKKHKIITILGIKIKFLISKIYK